MDNQAASAYFSLLGSLLYSEPSVEDIAIIKDQELFLELPFAADNETALKGQEQMQSWLNSGTSAELASAAKSDWVILLMAIDKVVAPPWGSVYLDREKLLFTEETLYVRRYYEHYGFELKNKYSEPDDHLGLELQFIAALLKQDRMEAVLDFAKTYILSWICEWSKDVQEHARVDYYRALANLAVGGIQSLFEEPSV